jgi:hypothetical protein
MSGELPDSAGMIRIVSRAHDSAQVRFGDCETVVTLRISCDKKGAVHVARSHWIRPPDEIRQRRSAGVVLKQTLGAAIGDLAFQFSCGLKDGYLPDESWFVPNLMESGGLAS